MTIPSDIRPYGPASPADDDVTSPIGGAADLTKTWEFRDVSVSQAVQLVSSNAGDVANTTVTVTGLDSGGNVVTDAKQPNGQTPVLFTQAFAQLLKATMPAAVTAGDIAVEDQVATRTGTAQAGAAGSITLDAGASAVDQFYTPMVIRLTGGTGAGQIRKIVDYNGTTKVATPDRVWTTPPDGTSVFRIATGMYFQLAPNQAIQVRRVLYNVVGPAFFQPTKTIYDKIFFANQGTSTINNVSIVMLDVTGKLAFGVAAVKNDSLTTPNRLTAPSGIAFGAGPTAIPGGSLLAGDYIGVWVRLTVPPGDPGFIDTVDVFSAVWT